MANSFDVEYKVWESGKSWEETAVYATHPGETEEQANQYAKFLAEQVKSEVRWNRKGTCQGHYVGTPFKWAVLYP